MQVKGKCFKIKAFQNPLLRGDQIAEVQDVRKNAQNKFEVYVKMIDGTERILEVHPTLSEAQDAHKILHDGFINMFS